MSDTIQWRNELDGILRADFGRENWARVLDRCGYWDWTLYDNDKGLFVAHGLADTEESAQRSVEAIVRVPGWIDDEGRLKP